MVVPDLRWWRQPTPFGDIEIEVGPAGVERVMLIAGDVSSRGPRSTPRRVASIAKQFDAYFAGKRATIAVPFDLDATDLSELQRHMLTTLRAEVPFGETVTYGELAELAGRPGAARAAGTAMSRNPVPFVIPCHRVVAANGIGGYGGGATGIKLKRALLSFEARARPIG